MQDDTLNLETSQDDCTFLNTGFELAWLNEVGQPSSYRVSQTRVFLGGPGGNADLKLPGLPGRTASLQFANGQMLLTLQDTSIPCSVNGQAVTFKSLVDGDLLQLGPHQLKVTSLLSYPGVLEGYRPGQPSYGLRLGSNPMGRPGKRENLVALLDPTVSRGHATFYYHAPPETCWLEAETDSSPTCLNGVACHSAQRVPVADGDLVQLGKVVLRFRHQHRPERRELCPQEATILFSDVWDYSTLSERFPLDQMIRQMNEFYAAQGRVIQAHDGVLMTFLGDALMAVFGTDGRTREGAGQAARAALAMQARLEELNQDWTQRGLPSLKIGVGVNTGEVMVGDVGFTGRLEFAAMGDNTNLAARLEKLTRERDARIIVSGSCHQFLEQGFQTRSLGSTQVKGRQAVVELYEVLGEAPGSRPPLRADER